MKRMIGTIGYLALVSLILTSLIACKKETKYITTYTDKGKDTTFSMNAANWHFFNYLNSQIQAPGTTTIYNEGDTLVASGQANNVGGRIQTKTPININQKVVYLRWKVLSNNQFLAVCPQLKYDPTTRDSIPAIQNVDFGTLTTSFSFGGSILIANNTWIYTRIAAVPNTDMYAVTFATGNYSNLGGTLLGSNNVPVYTKNGYLAIRITDCYAGVNAKLKLSEFKVQDN